MVSPVASCRSSTMTISGASWASARSRPATAIGMASRSGRAGALPVGDRGRAHRVGRRLAVPEQAEQPVDVDVRGLAFLAEAVLARAVLAHAVLTQAVLAQAGDQLSQPLLDHRPGHRGHHVPGRPTDLRTRSASGANRRRSPNARQRARSIRAPVCVIPARAGVVPGGEPLDLGREAGLADAGLGRHHQHPRRTRVDRLGQAAGHPAELGLAAHERRLVAQTGPGAGSVVQAEQLVRRNRLALALEPQRAQLPPGGDVTGAARWSGCRRRRCRPRPRRPAGRPC